MLRVGWWHPQLSLGDSTFSATTAPQRRTSLVPLRFRGVDLGLVSPAVHGGTLDLTALLIRPHPAIFLGLTFALAVGHVQSDAAPGLSTAAFSPRSGLAIQVAGGAAAAVRWGPLSIEADLVFGWRGVQVGLQGSALMAETPCNSVTAGTCFLSEVTLEASDIVFQPRLGVFFRVPHQSSMAFIYGARVALDALPTPNVQLSVLVGMAINFDAAPAPSLGHWR